MPTELVLVAFDGVNTAEEAFAQARTRAGASSWPRQVGFVEHHKDGHLVVRGTFAGHYVDVDEALHASETGAAKGWRAGELIGLLLGPPGFAVGSVVGAVVGSQKGEPSDSEPEPTALADQLRTALPAPGSGIVLVASPDAAEEMLEALNLADAYVTRRAPSEEELALLDGVLREAPLASAPQQGDTAHEALGPSPR